MAPPLQHPRPLTGPARNDIQQAPGPAGGTQPGSRRCRPMISARRDWPEGSPLSEAGARARPAAALKMSPGRLLFRAIAGTCQNLVFEGPAGRPGHGLPGPHGCPLNSGEIISACLRIEV
jgi:hypothetical protein